MGYSNMINLNNLNKRKDAFFVSIEHLTDSNSWEVLSKIKRNLNLKIQNLKNYGVIHVLAEVNW